MTMTQPWTTHRLLPDQLGLAPEAAAHKALRTRSIAVADALALSCTAGAHGSETLKRLVLTQGPPSSLVRGPRLGSLAAMAMIWAGSASSPDDLEAAAIVVDHLWGDGTPPGLSADQHLAAGQILFLAGRHTRLGEVLPLLEGLDPMTRHYMVTDLANPFLDASGAPSAAAVNVWSELLSRAFVDQGLAPLALIPGQDEAHNPFDRLDAPAAAPSSASGELVTVIMPCFQPDRGLFTSVRSISHQTWADLEIVVVDDASGPGFDDVFAQAVSLDPRARLLRLERNGGSYLAREAAIAQSVGSLVTFQDADDWSHPSRIEHQVAALAASSTPMSRSQAVRAKDDLTHQWLGSEPIRPNASSLMVRRSLLEQWGGFVPVRKGADSEFAERITSFAGAIADTHTPLAITRLRSGSLSRGDFMYHWTTPDRTAFRTAFQAWHRELRADVDSGRVTSISTAQLHDLPFPVPLSWVRALPNAERTPTTLDVAYVGNFSTVEPSRCADALRRSIKRNGPRANSVGMWHLEAPWQLTQRRPRMSKAWLDLMRQHAGMRPLCRVEPMHVDCLVVVDPEVLTLVTNHECRVRADQVELWLSPEVLAPNRSGLPIDLLEISDIARRWWGVSPRWTYAADLSAADRRSVAEALPGLALHEPASSATTTD